MEEVLDSFANAWDWASDVASRPSKKPHLLLGNGFSIAYDSETFSYSALRNEAERLGLVGDISSHMFNALGSEDFEQVIKSLEDAARALRILDPSRYHHDIETLEREAAGLKEALAQVLAGLHPERPGEISDATYLRVRGFLERFAHIFTANYDLLLYWTLMQDFTGRGLVPRRSDDGFRDPGYDADYVTWNYLAPHSQNVYYLHGALHLYRSEGELIKLTWVRTGEALIDQIRVQLANDSYPLYVAEGSSSEKLERIQTSDYLARGLRSLAACGGGLVCYGLSFAPNDAHLLNAIEHGKVSRLAVSIFGDPSSPPNRQTIASARLLADRREAANSSRPLEVKFYDAGSVDLW